MTTVANIANQIGLEERPGERGVLMAMVSGKPRHAYLSDAAEIDPAGYEALYAASGLFRDGSIKGNAGRSAENLTRVLWLPFDADLLDYMGCQPSSTDEGKAARKALQAELGAMPDDELHGLISALRTDLESTFAKVGMPVHRLDYTGYGLCAYVYVDEADQTRIEDARAAHKHLVEAINNQYGDRLVDPQCSDAGTRVTRVPESHNNKGAVPRLVQALIPYTGQTCPLGHRPGTQRPMAAFIPSTGDGMSQEDAQAFIAAMSPFWSLGQRHAVALAVAGMLAKAGIPESQAIQIVEALSHTDGDVWTQAITEVQTTYRRARAGSLIAGFTQLRSLMTPAALTFVDAMLDRYRVASQAASGPVSVGVFDVVGAVNTERLSDAVRSLKNAKGLDDEARNKRISDLFPLPPANAYFGSFGRWKDLMSPTTEAPEVFHLGAALTAFGAMMERRVCVEYASEPLYGNLYTTLIGSTGKTRKDTAIKRVMYVGQRQEGLRVIVPPYHIGKDVSSAEGIVNTLKEHANTILYLTELSHLQKNAQRKGTRTIMDRLIEAWDTPTVLENLTKGNPLQARNPFLSIIAATQPTRLADNMTDEDIESGFANRWLFIFGKPRENMSRPPKVDWSAAWDVYVDWFDAISSYPQGSILQWDGTADKLWDDWYYSLNGSRSETDDEDAMSIRHPVLAQKLALTFAVSERSRVISIRHVEAAIALIEWMWSIIRELMRGWGVGVDSQIELTVIQALTRFGPMQRRHLQQKCSRRRWSGRDFAAVFRAMMENGQVLVDAMGVVSLPIEHGSPYRSTA